MNQIFFSLLQRKFLFGSQLNTYFLCFRYIFFHCTVIHRMPKEFANYTIWITSGEYNTETTDVILHLEFRKQDAINHYSLKMTSTCVHRFSIGYVSSPFNENRPSSLENCCVRYARVARCISGVEAVTIAVWESVFSHSFSLLYLAAQFEGNLRIMTNTIFACIS